MSTKKEKKKKIKGINPKDYIELEPMSELFNDIEELDEEDLDILENILDEQVLDERAPMTIQQRRKRGQTMRRFRSKIKMARKRAARRKASPEKLKARAQKKARNIIRKRLSGQKSYGDMSPAEKIALDKRLQRISPTAIDRIAKKQLPLVRKAEMDRLRRVNSGPKTESLDEMFETFLGNTYHCAGTISNKKKKLTDIYVEASEKDTVPKKRYHMALEKDGSVKIDKRFKIYKPKTDLTEEIYDLKESVGSLFEDKGDPAEREQGTDSLVNIYKRDTPGEEIDESYLVELFKSAYNWKWYEVGPRVNKAVFRTETGDEVKVVFMTKSGTFDKWDLLFLRNNSSRVTKEGDQFKIFSTVFEIIRNFVDETDVKTLSFEADKSKENIFSGRPSLYKKMVDKFAPEIEMNSKATENSYGLEFELSKVGVTEATLDANIPRGTKVEFIKRSVYDDDRNGETLSGTFIGTDPKTLRMKIREDDGKLHIVRHSDVIMNDMNEAFSERFG